MSPSSPTPVAPNKPAREDKPAADEASLPQHHVVTFAHLLPRLESYLSPAELTKIREAYRFADEKHLGQMRKSGEPYISHPLAVAEICAEWKLDAQAIMAAFLHDVMEDQGVPRDELAALFGPAVASMVDGLSKLDKLKFQSQLEAQAENFRKMLLAMARDVRVILVKLADRLHNMRTLGSMIPEKKRRISRETMEVYVPIAHRLGLNNVYRELQDLSFNHMYPVRYRTLQKAIKSARGNRREVVTRILESVKSTLIAAGLTAQIEGREKTLYGIYRKMRNKHLSFSQVLDIYGFRVIVDTKLNCYMALGALHSLFKPMPGKFKDYIAIPKLNGYQSLHTTLVGPYGTPVEFQIRTEEMHHVAEAGVAAHWLYKDEDASLTDLQQRTHVWLQSLLDIQQQTGDSVEFLENVKIDLFPGAGSVYVFTPKSKIMSLPRGATALDFAYNIHTDIGDQTVSVIINNAAVPLNAELHNGDVVEIVTSPEMRPNPNWLNYVRTGKARAAIRNRLRAVSAEVSEALGHRLLDIELTSLGVELPLEEAVTDRLLHESGAKSITEIYIDIGIGKRMAQLIARHIIRILDYKVPVTEASSSLANKADPVMITGNEGNAVQFATCCTPVPGDKVYGNLKHGQLLIVHHEDCYVAKKQRYKEPDRWIDVAWQVENSRKFNCRITVLAQNDQGTLARIAAQISDADANIISVSMDDDEQIGGIQYLHFTIQVTDRIHLARTMRNIRTVNGVTRILRERNSSRRDL